ncbi:MAG: PrsW family intramembrane metalloprotease [Lachnospiraceae bacterium]|nr:PrsW family intramembrane metalloprotease [Lachnospiraceae bacterium]
MVYSENILICIAIPLLISLLFTGGNTRRFILSFIFGMGSCLIAAYISGFIKYSFGLPADDTAVYYSPVIEEVCKLLPMLFYMFVFLPHDGSLFTAALGIGLGFATFENCCYILSEGAYSLPYIIIRGMAAGVMHLVCALVLVMGFSMAKRLNALTLPGIMGALALSTAFHGLYNILVSEPGFSTVFGYLMPVMTAGLLYLPYSTIRAHKKQPESE